jgi:hypothetical protein
MSCPVRISTLTVGVNAQVFQSFVVRNVYAFGAKSAVHMSDSLAVITEQETFIFEVGYNLSELGIHKPHDVV